MNTWKVPHGNIAIPYIDRVAECWQLTGKHYIALSPAAIIEIGLLAPKTAPIGGGKQVDQLNLQCLIAGLHVDKRLCLNKLQEEYDVKIKLLALDWQWLTLHCY